MTNVEFFGCDREKLFAAWKAYAKTIEDFLDKRGDDAGGFALVPVLNPFTWLWKRCDTALSPDFDPGKLVVDTHGRYGVVIEKRIGHMYDHYWAVECLLVDFRGTAGEVTVNANDLKPAEFPKELVEFAIGNGREGLKERVHEKVEEAFNG